jgi:formate C-acetyltransferase
MRARMNKGNAIGRYTVWKDFDHIIPEWDKVLKLGFPGMKSRLRANWKDDVSYYRAELMASDAVDRLLNRLIAQGRARGGARAIRQAESLTRLRDGAPQTAYDVMQFIYLYFVLSEHFEAVQARSLSIIDQTLWPYYQADLAAGRTTEAEFREQFAHFLWQWGSIDNYWGQPVTMGGTKADGTTEYNPLSLVILDVMDQCALPTPKFHLKVAPNTPDAVLNKALDMARRHRPLSFIGELPVRAVLEHIGFPADDARRFVTKGCYEFCTPESGNGLGGGHVNLVKVVELILADAKDGTFAANDFASFKAEYLRRAAATAEEVREFFFTFEKHLDDVNPALVASLAGEFSVQTGRDALANGTRTGNRTGVCLSGFGTAVDALLAVKEIVYERKEMSLAELGALMAANWKDHEELRLRMLRSKRKWGVNDPEANALGSEISKRLSSVINGRPNSRGGRFGMSGHNARQFIVQGAKTGATPDGRRKGEEFSKNLSPTMGADTEGVTALIQTLAALDSKDFPGDFPLDVMLLPYTVSGDKGLEMMKALLSQYYANGGLMMQFNVFDAEELRDAQAHPEKYENLQVRVCGWNVRWNDLPKVEQDAYIRRAEEIAR